MIKNGVYAFYLISDLDVYLKPYGTDILETDGVIVNDSGAWLCEKIHINGEANYRPIKRDGKGIKLNDENWLAFPHYYVSNNLV